MENQAIPFIFLERHMALVTVYDKDGKPMQAEPVDARELVKFGGYTSAPPEIAPIHQTEEAATNEEKTEEKTDAIKVGEAVQETEQPAKSAESKKK
jgi:hypothetical protein